MQIHSVGIDLGKTTFHLVALGAAGKVMVKKKSTQLPRTLSLLSQPPKPTSSPCRLDRDPSRFRVDSEG